MSIKMGSKEIATTQLNSQAEFCRTCLAHSLKLRDISECGDSFIWETMTGVKVHELSEYAKICKNCEQIIEKFRSFQKQCQQVEAILENYKMHNLTFNVEYLEKERLRLFSQEEFSTFQTLHIESLENTKTDIPVDSTDIKTEQDDSSNSNLGDLTKDEPLEDILETAYSTDIKNEQDNDDYSEEDYKPIIKLSKQTKKFAERRKKRKQNKTQNAESIKAQKKREKRTIVIDKSKAIEIKLTLEEQIKEREDRRAKESFEIATFKCEKCVLTFRAEYILNNHVERHTEAHGRLICEICEQRFSHVRQLRAHALIHAMRLQCLECGKRVRDRARLAEHVDWHAGQTYPCSDCDKVFQKKTTMRNHVHSKHSLLKYACHQCPKRFASSLKLKEHELRHSTIRPHMCDICNKGFYTVVEKEVHRATHTRKKTHYCVECDQYFKSAVILTAHLKRSSAHRDMSLMRFHCSKCPVRFESEALLTQHVDRVHAEIKELCCDQCPARYASIQGLRHHKRKAHEGFCLPKIHTCITCSKSFSSKALLINHIRVHTGERPYECEQCQRKFSQQSALRTHINLVHLKLKRTKKEREQAKAAEAALKAAHQENPGPPIGSEKMGPKVQDYDRISVAVLSQGENFHEVIKDNCVKNEIQIQNSVVNPQSVSQPVFYGDGVSPNQHFL